MIATTVLPLLTLLTSATATALPQTFTFSPLTTNWYQTYDAGSDCGRTGTWSTYDSIPADPSVCVKTANLAPMRFLKYHTPGNIFITLYGEGDCKTGPSVVKKVTANNVDECLDVAQLSQLAGSQIMHTYKSFTVMQLPAGVN